MPGLLLESTVAGMLGAVSVKPWPHCCIGVPALVVCELLLLPLFVADVHTYVYCSGIVHRRILLARLRADAVSMLF
jgi:hypothetical protein